MLQRQPSGSRIELVEVKWFPPANTRSIAQVLLDRSFNVKARGTF